ncbi:ankyrin repeat domain-containing protein [Microvirga sp. SRT01]|uniref:Ankyrin repeat domain-containing protein n=1 Tax=Sphingomonas longa TaxID=2778730 RepID=A0ABS2D2Z1_9SPHN|nr:MULTISPECIES: ankyrin repeat domain-containing protein [Alphaproteobacteria]MBM6575289.1 ankyrin repeat domain-containing protein [Sphingomonas sp. BT552]MBR7708339.1 ankyrin repeat domain-containing protein [Microvirga sp. SRT01]
MTANARCFPADTALPDAAMLQRAGLGQSARDLGEALLAGDLDTAGRLLNADPALAKAGIDDRRDMLTLAVASCKPEAIDFLRRAGAPADGLNGEGYPLRLALNANDPALAHRLLLLGASATPLAAPLGPMRDAIARNSVGAVTMLLDFHADPDAMSGSGKRPLHIALDMERFRIAELLLAKGADPFAIDVGGANLGTSASTPMLTDSQEDREAQQRLKARLPTLGWPDPAPDPRTVRRLALDGAWPPAGARGAKRVPQKVLALIAANAKDGASVQ